MRQRWARLSAAHGSIRAGTVIAWASSAPVGYRKYEVLGDIPNFEDRKTLEGFEKHRHGKASSNGWSLHTAARDLVVRGAGGPEHNRRALEHFYRTLIMGNTHGEALQYAACGMLVRVRGPSNLLRRLRDLSARVRTARGPAQLPQPLACPASRWLSVDDPCQDAPYRRRVRQWRVVFTSTIVGRSRPSVKAPVTTCFEPGATLWSGEPRPDGWVPLSDPTSTTYVLIDATPLGLSKLLEPIEPPELEEGACHECLAAPCYCALLAEYGR